jgi:hypothetical protein
MAGNGRRVAGIVAIVIGVLVGIFDVAYYKGRHARRGIAILVVCAVLLVLGVVLVVVAGRQTKA